MEPECFPEPTPVQQNYLDQAVSHVANHAIHDLGFDKYDLLHWGSNNTKRIPKGRKNDGNDPPELCKR